ncbi:hypothetical protein [Nocardia sp. NPDC050710]|uniref:hypothetical protein n=1 Tax=Nocardia sp. NPDC050710 TaxID=3157220 RepID=UPI0033CD0180
MSDQPVIGVLGAGGAVGSAVLAMLSGDRPRPGYRADFADLRAWCTGCQVVINCTGVQVASEIHSGGAHYVDPSARPASGRRSGGEHVAVYDAGAMPGAIGLLPRLLATQLDEEPARLSVTAGGLYRFTPASARDFLDTPDGWHAQATRVNHALGLRDSEWTTRFDGECVRRLLSSGTPTAEQLIAASRADTAGRAQYLSIDAELTGTGGTVRQMRLRTGPDLTAATAIHCARAVLVGEIPAGTHSADDVLDPVRVVPQLFGEEGSL